jgi:hypothetical protein
MNYKIAIIAAYHAHAQHYRRENGLLNNDLYINVTHPHQAYGHYFIDIITLDGWYNSDNACDAKDVVISRLIEKTMDFNYNKIDYYNTNGDSRQETHVKLVFWEENFDNVSTEKLKEVITGIDAATERLSMQKELLNQELDKKRTRTANAFDCCRSSGIDW